MTIYDDILNKAKSQEDLQDVVQYLKKPLHLLYELEQKMESLPDNDKNSIENAQVQIKLHNILHKYLPGMLDEYCKFALSYRNTNTIKNTSHGGATAKELLLENIARITEESNLLHEDFHENNKFKFLVHNKVASNLGGNGQPAVALKNQFDYQAYNSEQDVIFKKEEPKVILAKNEVEDDDATYSGTSFSLIEILLVIGFIAMAGILALVTYNKISASTAVNLEARNLDTLRAGAKNLFAAQPNYNAINSTVLNSALITPQSMINGNDIVNSFDGAVTIAPASLDGETNNGFSITYNNVPAYSCPKLVITAGSQFDAVKVGGTTVKSSRADALDMDATATACTATNDAKTLVFSSL